MGIYYNPGNESFTCDKNSRIYVDKTGLLEYLNEILGTNGKCDSTALFEDTKIAGNAEWKKYMNHYNVIHLDISSFWDSYKENIVEKIVEYIYKDFQTVFGNELDYQDSISYNLARVFQKSNIPFIIIIDEWDCVIRNSNDQELVHKYLQFLHSLFKSEESKAFLALAYITGILPIKKIKDESALNNIREFTMLK